MELPENPLLPISLLAACFNKTSATYKFYWFLAILNRVELGETTIKKHHLFADMVAQSWFTVNYFHVSFGKQDKLQQSVQNIKKIELLTIDADRNKVFQQLSLSAHRQTQRELWYFNAEVPHRFLSPWFHAGDMKAAYERSQKLTNNCLYAIDTETITINPAWYIYLKLNSGILKAFCYWNLAVYLQSKNPNVPDIPNKLIKTPVRKNLSEQRKFWDIVINELDGVDCIYTNTRLVSGKYAVEHFIPYAFVSHDLIWNLAPANPAFNSSKSDKLPSLDKYFDPFFQLQRQAIEIIQCKAPKNKLLEDYLMLFPLIETNRLERQQFLEQIQPLITIASNNGFQFYNYGQ